MGIGKAFKDGKCGKCGAAIKKDDDICFEKGKPPLCIKCAPPDARKQQYRGAGPKIYTEEEISVIAMRALIEKHPKLVVGDLVHISTSIGWAMKAEFKRRAAAGGK